MELGCGWMHPSSLVEIAGIFARTSAMMGNCRLPQYFSKSKAEEWFDIWRLLNERRMGRLAWSSLGPNPSRRPCVLPFLYFARLPSAIICGPVARARRLSSQDDNVDIWEDDMFPVDPLGRREYSA